MFLASFERYQQLISFAVDVTNGIEIVRHSLMQSELHVVLKVDG